MNAKDEDSYEILFEYLNTCVVMDEQMTGEWALKVFLSNL
jgi:hypothetical protein